MINCLRRQIDATFEEKSQNNRRLIAVLSFGNCSKQALIILLALVVVCFSCLYAFTRSELTGSRGGAAASMIAHPPRYCFIDVAGRVVLDVTAFQGAEKFSAGLAAVRAANHRWG